jgi:iron(III) transport system ATP-binding protein
MVDEMNMMDGQAPEAEVAQAPEMSKKERKAAHAEQTKKIAVLRRGVDKQLKGYKKADAIKKGYQYLELVGLQDYANKRIHEISGGQQQRTALARALIVEPKLCLLDEPLSNLDAALRVKMRSELKTIQRELGITMVFVTHDQEEALLLSDKMAIMEQGKLVQFGAPEEIFRNPATPFVREFLSLSNLRWEEDGTLVKVIKSAEC